MNYGTPPTAYSKVSVFGLGASNVAALKFILSKHPEVKVYFRSDEPTPPKEVQDFNFDKIFCGDRALFEIDEELMLLSPSVRRDRPEIALAEARGVKLSSDLEIYFEDRAQRPAFGITGSDGKSSCTYLCSEILKMSGIPASPCGNFGKSPLELKDGEIPVLELSSFQLSFIRPKLTRALITNITPNHLDWHRDFLEYQNAKLGILENADGFVYDFDDPISRSLLSQSCAFAAVSSELSFEELKQLCRAEHYVTIAGRLIAIDGVPRISFADALRNERHNIKNFLLSAGLCLGFLTDDGAARVISGFGGLPHRAEIICQNRDLRFINSSIDTTPGRTLCTLKAYPSSVVILCGKSKGASYKALAEALSVLSRGAILMGEVGDIVGGELKQLKASEFKVEYCEEMSDALRRAIKIAASAKGTCDVILSPGGTSFDKYKNFAQRGNAFRQAAESLIKELGEASP